jgi:hypothetical protein
MNANKSSVTTLEELKNSKRYVKGPIEYPLPEVYLQSFVDTLEGALGHAIDPIVMTAGAVTNLNADGTQNTSYSRYIVKVRHEIAGTTELTTQSGVIVTLDSPVPKLTLFRGFRVEVCLNGCIFRPDEIFSVPEKKQNNYVSDMQRMLDEANEMERLYVEYINRMQNFTLTPFLRRELLGHLVEDVFRKKQEDALSIRIVNEASENLSTEGSNYYVAGQDNTTAWNVYNALTYASGSKPFSNEPQRLLSIGSSVLEFLTINALKSINLGGLQATDADAEINTPATLPISAENPINYTEFQEVVQDELVQETQTNSEEE